MMRRLLALTLAGLLLAAGCGGSPEDDPNADLRARLQVVHAAVEARDVESARSALNGLREAAATHFANGDIERERAEAIRIAADHVQRHLGELEQPAESEDGAGTEPEDTAGEPDGQAADGQSGQDDGAGDDGDGGGDDGDGGGNGGENGGGNGGNGGNGDDDNDDNRGRGRGSD